MKNWAWAPLALAVAMWAGGCGRDSGPNSGGLLEPGSGAGGRQGGGASALPDAGSDPEQDAAGGDDVCASVSTRVGLLPVSLAFAFDVSGSMGKGDKPWHDKTLKWDPVVRATRGFFEDTRSQGFTASLTFFPDDGGEDERCKGEAYAQPDVAMTPLPSSAFGKAIADIEPQSPGDWRGGTPTKFVLQGTRSFIQDYRAGRAGSFAIVLVTDGYPQGCDDDSDSIDALLSEVDGALSDGVRTYVIGVANPPLDGAPDTVSELQRIAVAGGSERAFLIDTGDPTATVTAFQAAVSAIREAAATCNVAIPAAGTGREFDRRKVAVSYHSGATAHALRYDARCAGADAWHYDDEADPQQIVLCPSACQQVQADPDAALEVQFACDVLILL